MFKQFKAIIGITAVAGLGSFIAPSGDAPSSVMVAEPSEGLEPGDSFVVSNADGSECVDGTVMGDAGGIRPGAWEADVEPDGDWSVTIAIPENGPPTASGDPTPFPEGEYEIHAHCTPNELPPSSLGFGAPAQQEPGFEYDPITVTVVAAPVQEPEPEPEPAPTPPPAAAPTVVAAPTYTG